MIQLINILFLLSLPLLGWGAAATALDNSEVILYAEKRLPQYGTLQKTKKGLVYLKVSDNYIYDLVPLIQEPNVVAPPYFGPGLVGAHITIILPNEQRNNKPLKIGKKIPFRITDLYRVKPDHLARANQVYFIGVDSKQLEKIRVEAGLTPKILDHDFHITIGVEYND